MSKERFEPDRSKNLVHQQTGALEVYFKKLVREKNPRVRERIAN